MDDRRPYHHGDLRPALLAAAETVLDEQGLEAFSLRRVAKAVGVSHAAPAHHFGDTQGLLTALATEAFRRFVAAMEARQQGVSDPEERLVASGLGYLDFARTSPALFRLMFGSKRVGSDDPDYAEAARAAFLHLADDIAAHRGGTVFDHPAAMEDAQAVWAMVHGLAELMAVGRLAAFPLEDREAEETMARRLIARAIRRP